MPTRRLLLLALAVAPLAAFGGAAAALAVLLVLLLLVGALADWRLAGDVARVAATREVVDKLSLGAWNPVRLVLRNGAARALRLEVRDVYPPDFQTYVNVEEITPRNWPAV